MDTLHSNYVRFSVLAVSSFFFLVDPFAAIPAFLAINGASSVPATNQRVPDI